VFRGENAGGVWDPVLRRPDYRVRPDKDAPLWNRYTMVIYWWTADESDPQHAYRVAYNGTVNDVLKSWGAADIACRCVKPPQ